MPGISGSLKRLVVGRPFSSDRLSRERLPKRLALPTFAADALSAVAYAPDEILLTLAVGGVTTYALSPWVGLAVVALMAVVIITHRTIIHEYPSGGGDFEVAQKNLGPRAGRVVGAALLVDYVLTVAVSVAQASTYAASTTSFLHGYEVPISLAVIAVIAVVNLRGVRDSNVVLAVPVYLFMAALGVLMIAGAYGTITGTLGQAPSAGLDLVVTDPVEEGLTALGGVFLILRAFTSGCAALTGVEAVSNGVPSLQPPKSHNASIVLVMVGIAASVLIMGVIWLAGATGVKYVENPAEQLARSGEPVGEAYHQVPVIGQIAQAVFGGTGVLFALVILATVLVLCMAANTAFNGFPILTSILARSRYLPRQFAVRGDRLAYSNGIIALAAASGVLVWATGAEVTLLIQMYIVGVFVSFAFGQAGMVRHFNARLRVEAQSARRQRLRLGRLINQIGFVIVATVLAVVVITKFAEGAWVALLLMAVLLLLMTGISHHYEDVRSQLELPQTAADSDAAAPVGIQDAAGDSAGERTSSSADQDSDSGFSWQRRALSSRAVVLVTALNRPAIRALDVAAASRHMEVEALTVKNDEARTRQLIDRWRDLDIPMSLRIVYSPYREFSGPILAYVSSLTRRHPDDVVVVYIPEYLVGHWWEALLHNHAMNRLKHQLTMLPRVVIATVPWQLTSARERSRFFRDHLQRARTRRGRRP
ncbi:APC family permease [Helcobacillus massiliensis]|uniref:APC family permease n=1 Tax=Helcobacillus TaxID=1161125 RepID=UPI001EF7483D|nr:APC family permease [Helcobacillus massiliensis]MCG7426477.1 APC family permease [Helcobacillus sp. ACRRO]MCT1556942.1 APC family permease [Helcobacillus massiliensis]MCT2035331.1 APC family permease [Helcobacillus massiliensis]MCT2331454.1 APC family permease [Helcobacillus massiliensis]MDK7741012.1 APC family permease [Helcobacillus massiliensis]